MLSKLLPPLALSQVEVHSATSLNTTPLDTPLQHKTPCQEVCKRYFLQRTQAALLNGFDCWIWVPRLQLWCTSTSIQRHWLNKNWGTLPKGKRSSIHRRSKTSYPVHHICLCWNLSCPYIDWDIFVRPSIWLSPALSDSHFWPRHSSAGSWLVVSRLSVLRIQKCPSSSLDMRLPPQLLGTGLMQLPVRVSASFSMFIEHSFASDLCNI